MIHQTRLALEIEGATTVDVTLTEMRPHLLEMLLAMNRETVEGQLQAKPWQWVERNGSATAES